MATADALNPGAMQVTMRRELADGSLIEFEQAPRGWLTKYATPRQRDWRAYFWSPPDGDRERMTSVSTVLDTVCPKPGLPVWSEANGIMGAIEAVRLGEIDPHAIAPVEAVERVRFLGLGADRARDTAATRGLNIHALLEHYAMTGSPPNPADHPPEHAGYIMGLARFLLKAQPEPIAVEELVCSPQDGYAGRSDFRALVDGFRVRYDAKTNEKGQIWDSAHHQLRLYERAGIACGDDPSDLLHVVVFSADGGFREMPCAVSEQACDALLAFWREQRAVLSACDAANRAVKAARAT